MKKTIGLLLIVIGVIIIIFSIMILVTAFDAFTKMESSTEGFAYTLGKIIFPLLLTVFGRWVFRKGVSYRKTNIPL